MHRLTRAALVAAVAAGTLAPAVGANPASDLAVARERWAARDARDYSYRVQVSCFCTPDLRRPTTVRVVRGKPRSTPTAFRPYDTVPELFALVKDALETADEVEVTYAPNTGIPIKLEVDYIRMAADDEISIRITRIRAPRRG
jgi:hypothetical protein